MGAQLAGVDEAVGLLESALRGLVASVVEEVGASKAVGRISASSILVPRCIPPYPVALLDGCAVKAGLVEEGSELRVSGRSRPGGKPPRLGDGSSECIWVDTGAPLPVGADSVVPVEELEVLEGGSRVVVKRSVEAWHGVALPCSDASQGDPLVSLGEPLSLPTVVAAAALGVARFKVFGKLKACVAAVGDELADIEACSEGKVCEVNRMQISKILELLGVEIMDLGILPDRPEALDKAFKDAVRAGCNVVLFSGGSSVGLSDYTAKLAARGSRLFSGLALRPGRPTKAVVSDGVLIVALPGHPRSAHSALTEAVARSAARVTAYPYYRDIIEAVMLLKLPPSKRSYKLPLAIVSCRGGDSIAIPVSEESYMTVSWGLADGEIVVEPGRAVQPGEKVAATAYRNPRAKQAILDLADTDIISLGGRKAIKINLARAREMLASLSRVGCGDLIIIADQADVDSAGLNVEIIGEFEREVYLLGKGKECSLIAHPALGSIERLAREIASRSGGALLPTPRVETAVKLHLDGYVDCAVTPLKAAYHGPPLKSQARHVGGEKIVVARL